MKVNPKIFKKFDIRGIYPEEINEEVFFDIGRAFGIFVENGPVVVGRGIRLSAHSLQKAFIKGLNRQGIDVINIGRCTTPMLNFATVFLGAPFGVAVSASHNPSKYNGLKLIKAEGQNVLQFHEGDSLDKIKEIVLERDFRKVSKKGRTRKKRILKDYQNYLLKRAGVIKNLKVVVDYGNGAGALPAKGIFKKLPIKYYGLYEKPDGNFPNHVPDNQDIKNFQELQRAVLSQGADIGIFFDGDSDRCIPVNEKGEVEQVDYLVALFAVRKLAKEPGGKVYLDLRFSNAIKEIIGEAGGKPIEVKVGNPFYKEKLAREGGILAGESSGHIMLAENFGIDDGLFAGLRLLSIMSQEKKTLSELLAPFKRYYQAEEISFPCENPQEMIKKLEEIYDGGKNSYVDGLTVEYGDWWFNVRPSQTQPLIRLTLEGKTKQLMDEKLKEVGDLIKPQSIQ